MNIFLIILSAISITLLFTGSSIFGPIRKYILDLQKKELSKFHFLYLKLSELIMCNQCSGFWIGLIFYLACKIPNINFLVLLQAIFIYGPIVSLGADLAYRLKRFLCENCG